MPLSNFAVGAVQLHIQSQIFDKGINHNVPQRAVLP